MAVFQNTLYIAFQANDPSHSLYITGSADGVDWTDPALSASLAPIQIGSAPAMTAFNNQQNSRITDRLYIAFQANDPSNQLYVTSSGVGAGFFSPATPYPGIQIGSAPAMTVFNNQLYLAFQANDSSHSLLRLRQSISTLLSPRGVIRGSRSAALPQWRCSATGSIFHFRLTIPVMPYMSHPPPMG